MACLVHPASSITQSITARSNIARTMPNPKYMYYHYLATEKCNRPASQQLIRRVNFQCSSQYTADHFGDATKISDYNGHKNIKQQDIKHAELSHYAII